jgi:acetyl-CoA carboxylase biotin carboxyl carrier protein
VSPEKLSWRGLMNSNRRYSRDNDVSSAEQVSTAQLQHLVRLLDKSDVSEIEVKRPQERMRLVLKKVKANAQASVSENQVLASSLNGATSAEQEFPAASMDIQHTVTAPLVGIFHSWAKPKGKPVVAIGDRVKIGQLVGTIQSLNVISEVESLVAGRVVELLVQDGQPVEYGQPLVVIDTSEEG